MSWKPVFFGGAIVFLLGVWDDIRPIPAGVKFVVQGVAAGVAIWCGILVEHVSLRGGSRIALGALVLPLTFVWITGITNAFNLGRCTLSGCTTAYGGQRTSAILSMSLCAYSQLSPCRIGSRS